MSTAENVHNKRIVNVMGTSNGHGQEVELGGEGHYYSYDENSWICSDFGGRRVLNQIMSVCVSEVWDH